MMGGSAMYDDDWEQRTVVLVGRTGNGKSATGNSILGRKAFKSKPTLSAVTSTCDSQTAVLEDGQVVNVIDTPGLFDSCGSEFNSKEIVKCIDFAKDGIHGVLVVISVTSRFSQEEHAAILSLQTLFGSKIKDYMIVVFTKGDELEDPEETLEDFLGRECPEPLKGILELCENRYVLFDNKTKDKTKRTEQVGKLLSLVNSVIEQNCGQPYTDDIFAALKKGDELRDQQVKVDTLQGCSKQEISELKKKMQRTCEKQRVKIKKMVESRLKETINRLEQQLKQQKDEADAEILKLRKELERAGKPDEKGSCAIEQQLKQQKDEAVAEILKLRKELERAGKPDEKGSCAIL